MSGVVADERADALADRLLSVARPMLPAWPIVDEAARAVVEGDLAHHLSAQVRAMPTHLRLPVLAALVFFDALPVLRFGRPFRRVDVDGQRRILRSFAGSPIPQLRDFVKLVRSCALVAYMDHPRVRAALDAQTSEEPAAHGAPHGSA